jgi:hypothetical protein
MRAILGAALVVSLASSCFNPHLKNRSFACSLDDVPACPEGFTCIDGLCDDGSGGLRVIGDDLADLAGSTPADLGTVTPPSPPDFSTPPPPPPDFSIEPDLSQPQQCVPSGGDCTYHNNKICCSNYCIYKTNTCR